MPQFVFKSPEGKEYVVNGPEGSTQEQAWGILQQQLGGIPQPKAEPETPGVFSQILGAPKEVAKGFIRGLTVDPISGLTSLGYTGARAAGAEMTPFEQTGFGQALGRAQTALAPSDAGLITQFAGGVGSLASFLPGGLLKGGIKLATLGAQATGVGTEEARARAEQARLEGKEVTPQQQFQAQLGGAAIGLTELAPVERLVGPLQAVLRGIPADKAAEIAPGLFNSAKRMLVTGGIEGLQEGMANIAQDLTQKGIYDPTLEVGQSALGDAAMGASVGAFAQGAIELVTRGKRTQMYERLKAEEREKEFNDKMAALQQEEQEQIDKTKQNLGVPDTNVLALPAPSPQVEAKEERDPLMNPVGFFNANELTPAYLKAVNDIRDKEGKAKLQQFSVEDLADAGAPQGELDRLLTYKTGFDGSVKLSPQDVLNIAEQKNIDTSTVGFTDFLRRSTGSFNLNKMSQPQLFSAFKALDEMSPSETLQVLPQGTNATRFTQEQYDKSLKSLSTLFPSSNLLGRSSVLKEIKDYSGLESDRDAESLLQTAIRKGDLDTVSKNKYDLVDSDGKVVRTYLTRSSAERAARGTGFSVRESTSIDIALPGTATQLPGGPDIRKGTFQEGVEPAGFEVRSTDAVLSTSKSQEEAEAKADRLTALRQQKALGFLGQAQKIENEIAKSTGKLESMEADGKVDTLEYKQLAAKIAANNKNLQNQADRLKAKADSFSQPLEIAPKGEKPTTREGFTLFEQGKPVATFPNQQAAEEAALTRLPDDILQRIVNLAPAQKGLMPKRLGAMARDELSRRAGQMPEGIGVTFRGTREEAEARLAEAGIFTGEFKKKADELSKKLRPVMDKLGLKDLRLNIEKAIMSPMGEADGYYAQRLIAISMSAPNPIRTLRHEGIHALKELGAFTPDQWRVLENRARTEWMSKYKIADRYKGLDLESQLEEAISDAFSDFDQTQPPAGMIGALFRKIKQFLEALRNGIRGIGFQSADGIFAELEAGKMQPDPRILNFEPLVFHGAADVDGKKYSLLQHGSPNNFDKLDPNKLGAFAFGYGAYTTPTPGERLSPRSITKTVRDYASGFQPLVSKGFVYVSDVPLNKTNTINLYEGLDKQPLVAERLIDAGIVVEAPPDRPSWGSKFRMAPQYGGTDILSGSDVLQKIESKAVEEILSSGYPTTGLMGERKLSAVEYGPDPFEIKKRAAKVLNDAGIEALWKPGLFGERDDPYVVVLNPERFNENIVGKYELQLGGVKTIQGQKIKNDSLLSKIKDLLISYDKGGKRSKAQYEDLPEIDGRRYSLREAEPLDRAKYQLSQIPRVMSTGKIVGAPPGMSTEADRKKLITKMTKLLDHPFTMFDESRFWYENSGDTIREMTRGNPELMERVVRLIALYSQANSLGGNTTATIKSIAQLAQGADTALAGRFPNETAKRIPAILSAPTMDSTLPGVDDKLMNFYRNLRDATFKQDTFADASTVDRWMMRLFGYPHAEDQEIGGATGVSNTQYLYAKDLLQRIADAESKKTGEVILPRQIQAALWTYVRNKTEYDSLPKEKQATFEPKNVDFADYVTRATANITWESRPSTSLPLIPGIHKASRKDQEAFNRAVRAIFEDENGNDKIFQLLGNQQLYSSEFSEGAYENLIAPNIITKLVLQKDEGGYLTDVADNYAAIVGYVTKQDAVPWYRADPTATGKDASVGYRVTPSIASTPEFEEKMFKHLNEKMPGIGFTRVGGSFDFINFRDVDTGKPFAMPDKKYVEQLKEALRTFAPDVNFEMVPFRAKSGWISNNWKENPDGQGYLERLRTAGLGDLQRVIEGWSETYNRIADDFGREYGWSDPRQFSLRSSIEGDGISLGERQPGAITVDAVHYGKQKVPALAGRMYGTGIRGAEARRLADAEDARISNRVYFYIPQPNGKMPIPESGLGGHVYVQRFNNILGPGEEMTRLSREAGGSANGFESAVIDAGYDGYAIPEMGMMVVLNNDVPVEYRGTRDEVSRKAPEETVQIGDRRYALRQTDTPEFKQWFGKSQVVASLRGEPKRMYHGTARDITEFRPKQADAIFVTDDPDFAESFSDTSESFMADELYASLNDKEKSLITRKARIIAKGKGTSIDDELTTLLKNRLPTRANIMPLYVRAEAPFDFQNPKDVQGVIDYIEQYKTPEERYEAFGRDLDVVENLEAEIKAGAWMVIENPAVQEAIKFNRHDGFYVREGGRKNLAVYDPNQIKSAIGNIGTFSRTDKDIRYALALGNIEPSTAVVPDDGGNSSGNLGLMPQKLGGKPIRLLVGTHDDIENKGYGANHILNRVLSDPRRMPEGAEETLEKIARTAQRTAQNYRSVYKDGNRFVLFDGKNSLVLSTGPDQQSIVTMFTQTNPGAKYGAPVWTGSAPLMPEFLEPVRGMPIEAREGRVAPKAKPVEYRAKRVITPSAVEQASIEPQRKGTITLGRKMSLRVPETAAVQKFLQGSPYSFDQETGEPLVFFRGQRRDAGPMSFDIKTRATPSFTTNPHVASVYASRGLDTLPGEVESDWVYKDGSFLIPSFIRMKAPIDLRDYGNRPATLMDLFNDSGVDVNVFEEAPQDLMDVLDELAQLQYSTMFQSGGAFESVEDALDAFRADINRIDPDSLEDRTDDAQESVSNAVIGVLENLKVDPFAFADTQKVLELVNQYNPRADAFIVRDVMAETFAEKLAEKGQIDDDSGYDTYKPFEVNQVKSVFNFNPKMRNKDIRFSMRKTLDSETVDAIERTTTSRQEQGFAERMMEAISPQAFARFRQGMINKYEGIERLSRDVAEKFGSKELLADTSAIAAALFSDRASGVAASSFRNGVPIYSNGFTTVSDLDGKVQGLIPILEPLAKYGDPFVFRAFQFYAATKRGKRLTAEGREKLLTPDDLKKGELLERQYPEFKQVFDEYQKYNAGLVRFMRDTGVLSEKEAEIWTQNWDYIPFYRQMEGERTAGPNIFAPIAGVAKPKKLKGGEAPLADFMETVVRNARAAIEAGMKNVAAQKVVRDMVRLNQGELVAPTVTGADVITVKENGLTKHYRVDDPLLVESLKGLNLPQLPFLEILAKPSEVLRNLVTKDPGFMLANLMRDSLQAWVTTGTNITPIVDTFKQWGAALANMSPEARALAKAGLFTGYDFAGDVKSTTEQVESELRKRTKTMKTAEKALMPLSAIWDALEKGSTASDVATRAEVYKRVLKETGNEAEAMYQAMEVLNFSRKGNSALIRVLTALVPFMNARIQGLDVLYRSGFGKMATATRERQQKAFMTRSLTLLGLSAMYWALASDTEEYETAEQEVRDNYWIFGNVRIPIPFEIGTVFKVFPERILEYFFGMDTGKDLKDSVVRNITSTLAFNPIPQAFLPIVENVANYSFFTGQPIIGKGLEDVAPRYQVTPGTSLLAQEVGELTGSSPVKVDNLIRGYTGTLGTYAVMMLDAVMRGEGDPTKAAMRAEQMPVIKRFFASPESTGTVTAYYEMKGQVDEATRTINFLERTGNYEDLQEYMQDKGAKLMAVKPYIQTLDKDMTMLRELRRAVQISGLDPEAKRDVLDNIRSAEVALTSRIQYIKKSIE